MRNEAFWNQVVIVKVHFYSGFDVLKSGSLCSQYLTYFPLVSKEDSYCQLDVG